MAEMGGLGDVGQARGPDETDRLGLVRDKGRAGRPALADRNRGPARWPCRGGPPPCPGGPEPGPAAWPRLSENRGPPAPAGGPPRSRSGRRPPGFSASTATEGEPTGGDVNAERSGSRRTWLRRPPPPPRRPWPCPRLSRSPSRGSPGPPVPVDRRHLAGRAVARSRA